MSSEPLIGLRSSTARSTFTDSIVLPEHDVAFRKHALDGHYQRQILMVAMSHVRNWTKAVDVGAHVGFIARDMAKMFRKVYAFEPVPENVACLQQNVPENVVIRQVALGADLGRAGMHNPADVNTGAWELCHGDAVDVVPLDEFELKNVGLIKIDVQGSEMDVLKGARETLERNKPVVLLETPKAWRERIQQGEACETMDYLLGLGAVAECIIRQDVVMRWPE